MRILVIELGICRQQVAQNQIELIASQYAVALDSHVVNERDVGGRLRVVAQVDEEEQVNDAGDED